MHQIIPFHRLQKNQFLMFEVVRRARALCSGVAQVGVRGRRTCWRFMTTICTIDATHPGLSHCVFEAVSQLEEQNQMLKSKPSMQINLPRRWRCQLGSKLQKLNCCFFPKWCAKWPKTNWRRSDTFICRSQPPREQKTPTKPFQGPFDNEAATKSS